MCLWEKGYCDQGLFVLNILEVVNKFSLGSSTYIVDSYDM